MPELSCSAVMDFWLAWLGPLVASPPAGAAAGAAGAIAAPGGGKDAAGAATDSFRVGAPLPVLEVGCGMSCLWQPASASAITNGRGNMTVARLMDGFFG